MKFTVVVAGCLVLPVCLWAQAQQLKEVVIKDNHVQVRKQEESLNVDIVGPEFIQRNLGGSLMQTLERLPGIKSVGIGSGQSKPLIRGMGFNRVMVVDKGVKHEGQQWGSDHGLEIDQFATGEVEVIRGSASFMYGSDAIGGVIDIKPVPVPDTNTLGGAVDLVGKSNNQLYGLSVNLFKRKKHFFFDARFTYQDYGDYRVPADTVYVYSYAVGLHKNHLRNTAGRERNFHLNLGYEKGRFKSVFYTSHIYSHAGYFANAHGLEPRQVDTALHDASSRDILMPNQEVSHFKVINRTVYKNLEMEIGYQRNFRQEFSRYVNHGYMPPVYPDTMKIPSTLERAFKKNVYSLHARNKILLGGHTLTIGGSGEFQDNAISGWTFLVPAYQQVMAGMFVYDKYKLSDQVILHGAVRYDYGHISTQPYMDWFPSGNEFLTRAQALTRDFNSFVWSIGMNYNREQLAVKANVGKSFRMPIAKELAANGVNYHYFSYEQGNAALQAEQSYQADISVGWNGARLSARVSPFYNYFPNYIYLNPTPAHDHFYGAGNQVFRYEEARVMRYGGELVLTYKISKSLVAEVLGEYLYARQLSGKKAGYSLPFSPPPSVLLNMTWSPVRSTFIAVDYRLVSKQDRIVPPEKKTPGYTVCNIQAGTRVVLWRQPLLLNLQVQNILDKKYFNHTSFYRLIDLPEAGRNFIVSLKIPFK
jgi:iron complex outermembrane receptor protein